jgi:hypothetical protein
MATGAYSPGAVEKGFLLSASMVVAAVRQPCNPCATLLGLTREADGSQSNLVAAMPVAGRRMSESLLRESDALSTSHMLGGRGGFAIEPVKSRESIRTCIETGLNIYI